MRVTVCQLPDAPDALESAWERLCRHTSAAGSDLVVLPEMAFAPWPMHSPRVDPAVWEEAVGSHLRWLDRLPELGAPLVAGTRPVVDGGSRRNRAFVWSVDGGLVDAHDKYHLPDEPGFWEATWYHRGDGSFHIVAAGETTVGFLVCTELWFGAWARAYGRDGAALILTPRATPAASRQRWVVGGRAAAIVAGAYEISSNRAGSSPGVTWAGTGWVIDPDGEVLAITDEDRPFATVPVDLDRAAAAKATYPRYVD